MKHTNEIPKSYKRRTSSTINFGYELSEIEGYLKPIPKDLTNLKEAIKMVKAGKSTRKTARWLNKNCKSKISHMGLWKLITYKTNEDFKRVCDHHKEGYIYIITNAAWKGWVKIGRAVNDKDRLSAYQTYSPHRDYKIYYSKKFKNKNKAESLVHNKLKKQNIEHNCEWFRIPKTKAVKIIKSIKL